jgi:hypothetical protein
MNMRRGLGAGWALLTVVIAGVVAWFAYHAGLATTIASSGAAPAVRDGVYYGGYPGAWGFGFGFFPLLLFILLLVFLFRRRRWYGGYWGGRGYWGGHGPWGGYGPGKPGEPGQPHQHELPPVIDEKLRAWHEAAHGNTPGGQGSNPPEASADKPSGTSGPV